MRRFTGMTSLVATFLVKNVFCILDDPTDDSQRINAREFGVWIRDLPTLMGASQPMTPTHTRVPPAASIATGHPLTSAPTSHRPSSRRASVADGSPRRLPAVLCSLTRDTSWGPVLEHGGPDSVVIPAPGTVRDKEDEEEEGQQATQPQIPHEQQREAEIGRPPPLMRSTSITKHRKGKGMTPSDHVQTSESFVSVSKTLACELSNQMRSTSLSVQSFPDVLPPSGVVTTYLPTVTKMLRRWKPSPGRSAGEVTLSTRSNSDSDSGPSRATDVSKLIMGPGLPSIPPQKNLPSPLLRPSSMLGATGQRRGKQWQRQQPQRATSPTGICSGREEANVLTAAVSSNWRNSMASTSTSRSTFGIYAR
jgi:hypothetical protein